MNWFFIALAAPFLWSLVNISDHYLVSKYSTEGRVPGALVLFSSLIGILVAFLIGMFTYGIFQIPVLDKLLLAATGVITIAWVIIYFFVLNKEDVSSVVPWFLTVPIFGYILGYLFLGEVLSFKQQIGSLIVLIGVFLVSMDFSKEKHGFKLKSAMYMALACFLISIIGVFFKYVTVEDNFWISSFWVYVGLGTSGAFIFLFIPSYRNSFLLMNKIGGIRIFTLNTISETFTIIGNLLTSFAILLAPVTLVYLVGSFQPAILLILTLIATRFFPYVVHENISKRVLVPKIFAISIMIIGSTILFL